MSGREILRNVLCGSKFAPLGLVSGVTLRVQQLPEIRCFYILRQDTAIPTIETPHLHKGLQPAAASPLHTLRPYYHIDLCVTAPCP